MARKAYGSGRTFGCKGHKYCQCRDCTDRRTKRQRAINEQTHQKAREKGPMTRRLTDSAMNHILVSAGRTAPHHEAITLTKADGMNPGYAGKWTRNHCWWERKTSGLRCDADQDGSCEGGLTQRRRD